MSHEDYFKNQLITLTCVSSTITLRLPGLAYYAHPHPCIQQGGSFLLCTASFFDHQHTHHYKTATGREGQRPLNHILGTKTWLALDATRYNPETYMNAVWALFLKEQFLQNWERDSGCLQAGSTLRCLTLGT